MPDLQISNDVVEFGEVKCGECKIITVQIYNHKEVRCDWNASYLPKKDEKFTPMHLKRKKKQADTDVSNKPRTFEIMPPTGILMPGQRVNIQLKFMPGEEKMHEERVTIRMGQSSQRLMILCKGKGLEPRLEFSLNSLEFEPILPHSIGDEREVKVSNPCPFPIEVYNLEFDKNYLEEEKVLRVLKGYDEFNTILLPPRGPGDKLPNEIVDYYDELTRKLEEEEKKQKQLSESLNQIDTAESARLQSAGTHKSNKTNKTKSDDMNMTNNNKPGTAKSVGDVEKNPVFDSIAQYLGIDLSVEGRAARNRRGVSVIVNGPPLSGKSKTAVALAKHYDAALLTIDQIIIDAITTSQSAAAYKVRQICSETAAKVAEEARAMELNKINSILDKSGNASTQPPGQPGLSEAALAQHTNQQGTATLAAPKRTSVTGESNTTGQKAPNKKGKPDISLVDQASTNVSHNLLN